jgi:signal transduction histidine kinase
VLWLDPTRALQQARVPPVVIQSVAADDKNYAVDSSPFFPAHTSSVAIRYSAISLSDPAVIRSRVKLRETDADWHEVNTGDPVTYRNLGPGHYHFSVNISDTNGVWSDKTANVEFTVLPAWYQTTWFRALCGALFLLLLWFLYQLRLRQLQHQFNIGLEAQVSERTRIARELHDTLLQSFHGSLLHFQAASNLWSTRPDDAKKRLDAAIDQGSLAIAEGRDAVQALRSSAQSTNDLAVALRILGDELVAGGINAESPVIDVTVEGQPRPLRTIVRDEVFRISAEALRNAFRHAQAKRIETEIRYGADEFRVRVRDDGKGIDAEAVGGSVGHFGLPGMRERAKVIGANLEVWSNRGSGTEVQLTMPHSIAYEASEDQRWYWFLGRAKSNSS